MYVPYYKYPYHPDYEVLTKQIEKLFEIVTSVEQFCIAGGEPLLRKDLYKVLDYLYNYEHIIKDEILIITNGTLIPDIKLLESSVRFKNKVRIVVNDYGKLLSHKVYEAVKVIKECGIRYELREQYAGKYFGGWVDYRNLSKRYLPEEAEKKFKECANPNKVQTFILQENGYIFPCQRLKKMTEMGIAIKEDEFVNIFDETETLEAKRKKIMNFYKQYYSSCLHCDGMTENSPRFQAGEQLVDGESIDIFNTVKV